WPSHAPATAAIIWTSSSAAVVVGVSADHGASSSKRSTIRLMRNQATSEARPIAMPCRMGASMARNPVKNPPSQKPMTSATTAQRASVAGSVPVSPRPASTRRINDTAAMATSQPAATHTARTFWRCSVCMSGLQFEAELSGGEGTAVVRREAQPLDRRAVLGRAVAGVLLPAVAGIACREPAHEPVPLDDRGVPLAERRDGQAIHEQVLRRDAQPLDGALHGQMGGAQDVQPVDLARARGADAVADRACTDLGRELFTQRGREAL